VLSSQCSRPAVLRSPRLPSHPLYRRRRQRGAGARRPLSVGSAIGRTDRFAPPATATAAPAATKRAHGVRGMAPARGPASLPKSLGTDRNPGGDCWRYRGRHRVGRQQRTNLRRYISHAELTIFPGDVGRDVFLVDCTKSWARHTSGPVHRRARRRSRPRYPRRRRASRQRSSCKVWDSDRSLEAVPRHW